MSDKTKAGQIDDNAKRRAEENKRKKEKMLQEIFDDNKTGR